MKKIFLLLYLLYAANFSFSQGNWIQKKSLTNYSRYQGVSFSVNGHGYFGCGYDTHTHTDFWDYDPVNDTWTQVADITGARLSAVSFVIGSYGYVGTGLYQNNFSSPLSSFYKYDPSANTWTSVKSMDQGLLAAVGFSSGGRGYVYGGYNGTSRLNYLWEYDPQKDIWTRKADFPGSQRNNAVAFTIGNNSYVGSGFDGTTLYNDFFCYNSDSDTWHSILSYSENGGFYGASSFVIGGNGYICGGYDGTKDLNTFLQYNTNTGAWTKLKDYPGNAFRLGGGITIGSNGYVGLGAAGSGINSEWYLYGEQNNSNIKSVKKSLDIAVYPNPSNGIYNIMFDNTDSKKYDIVLVDMMGQIIYTNSSNGTTSQIDLSAYSNGIYFVQVKDNNNLASEIKIIKQ